MPEPNARARLAPEYTLALRIMGEETGMSHSDLYRWGIRLLWAMHRRGMLVGHWRYLAGARKGGRRRKKGPKCS